MKRAILAALACYALTPGVAAAADNVATATDSVGVVWMGKSGMANRVIAGFREHMSKAAPEFSLEVRKELPDAGAVTKAVGELTSKHKGIVVLRSSGSKWLAKNKTSVPAFIGGGNHPPTLGVVQNMDAPEGNVTGVTYFLDHTLVMETFVAIAPDATRIAVITQKGHPGGPIDSKGAKAACEKLFLECTFHEVAKGEGVGGVIAAAKDAQGFLLGNQAGLYDDKAKFQAAVKAAGSRPIFSLNKKPVEYGALASMAADDRKLGKMLAERVISVIRDGKSVAKTPVGRDPKPILVLNSSTMKRLKLAVPKQMLKAAKLVGDS